MQGLSPIIDTDAGSGPRSLARDLVVNHTIASGRFEIIGRLGAGGMGVVYEAMDHDRAMRVAVKRLSRDDPQALYRFKQEFRALQDLEHPNLVSFGELIEDDGTWFMTMELVEGTDLLGYVRPGGELDPDRLTSALAQLASGLAALHDTGRVHRDVKPANVLVARGGRVVLVDFGLVHEEHAPPPLGEQLVVGTAAYMAPEQAASKPVGAAADWYSFGSVLYEALTGTPPFEGNLLEILSHKQAREPTPAIELVPEVPAHLSALATDLLRFEPGDRPTARHILERLGAAELAPPSSGTLAGDAAPFVGRDAELERLRAAAARSLDGPVTLYAVGESGLGKTALLRHFTDELRGRSSTVLILRGRCYERESVNFKAFDGIMDSLSRHLQRLEDDVLAEILPADAGMLPLVFPVLGRIGVLARARRPVLEARDPPAVRTRMFAVLRALFTNLASHRPVVLSIDDFQWADADSKLLLAELMRPPGAPPLLVVISMRVAPPADERPRGESEIIELGPLAPALAERLASMLLARAQLADDGLASSIAAECGGHPLFIDEMVRHAALAGERPRRMLLDEVIRARIAELGTPARRLLSYIAVAGSPLDQNVLRDAADITPRDAERAASQLRVARMIRVVGARALEPYHDRVRLAVVQGTDAASLREIHARLAAALEGADTAAARPEMLIHHLVAAGEAGAAADYALRGARRASDGFAFDRAAELFELALSLGEQTPEDGRAIRLELANALANAGRGRDAAPEFLAAAQGADPATRVECQRRAARHLLLNGHFESGMKALEELLADQGLALPSTPRRALASLLWQRARLRVRGMRWSERHAREIADADLARVDVLLDVGEALGMFDSVRGADFQVRGLVRALALGEPQRIARAFGVEGIYMASQGGKGVARGKALVDRMHAIARSSNDPFLESLAWTANGIIAYLSGDLALAMERMREVIEQFHDLGSTWELNNARLFGMFASRWTCDVDARWRELEGVARDAFRRGDLYTETSMRLSNNLLLLAADRPDDAELDLDAVSWRPPGGHYHLQHWWELEARTELALYRGDVAEKLAELEAGFDQLGRSLFTRIQFVRANSRWLRARMYLGSGRPELVRKVRKLAAKLERENVAYARGWALLLRAGCSPSAADAGALLEEAIAIAERVGMPLVARLAARRRAALLGDAAAIDATDEWLRAEGVREPARLLAVLVPSIARVRAA
jgi:hypothetical protein